MKHGRRKKKEESLDVPITPMLDMAFQLLTFFILTYHPMPAEGLFSMNLLPAAPASDPNAKAAESTAVDESVPAALKTLPATLLAGDGGSLGRIMLADHEVQGGVKGLKTELDSFFQDPTAPFEQTVLKVDPDLRYSELIKVIDVFSRAFADAKKEPKLSFAELSAADRPQ